MYEVYRALPGTERKEETTGYRMPVNLAKCERTQFAQYLATKNLPGNRVLTWQQGTYHDTPQEGAPDAVSSVFLDSNIDKVARRQWGECGDCFVWQRFHSYLVQSCGNESVNWRR